MSTALTSALSSDYVTRAQRISYLSLLRDEQLKGAAQQALSETESELSALLFTPQAAAAAPPVDLEATATNERLMKQLEEQRAVHAQFEEAAGQLVKEKQALERKVQALQVEVSTTKRNFVQLTAALHPNQSTEAEALKRSASPTLSAAAAAPAAAPAPSVDLREKQPPARPMRMVVDPKNPGRVIVVKSK